MLKGNGKSSLLLFTSKKCLFFKHPLFVPTHGLIGGHCLRQCEGHIFRAFIFPFVQHTFKCLVTTMRLKHKGLLLFFWYTLALSSLIQVSKYFALTFWRSFVWLYVGSEDQGHILTLVQWVLYPLSHLSCLQGSISVPVLWRFGARQFLSANGSSLYITWCLRAFLDSTYSTWRHSHPQHRQQNITSDTTT